MANQRQYEAAMVFNARIVDMRHLWTPSHEYKGQQTQKPNYFAGFIVPKTVPQWHNEPQLAGVAQACMKLYNSNPQIAVWPVVDGDMPGPDGKHSEWAKRNWLFNASTGNPPNVELTQAGGQLVKLQNKVGVKSGDFVMVGVTAAVKQNDARGVKFYLNAVVFTAPGEEIVFANSVSGAELMRAAQQQGYTVQGFAPQAPGFGAPAGAFPGGGQPFGGGGMPNGGFTHGNPPQGQPRGFAPPNTAPGTMAPGAFGGAPALGGMPNGGGGNVTFPSNQPPANGFGAPAPQQQFGQFSNQPFPNR